MAKVLVVDDQEAVRTALTLLFEVHGFDVVAVSNGGAALDAVAHEDVGVVIQDMNLGESATSGEDGVALFREIRSLDPELPVILITAWTSLSTAVELVREGAADYLGKPWDDDKLVLSVTNLMRLREVGQENARLRGRAARRRAEVRDGHDLCGLVYESPALHEAVTLAVQVARADVPVLVTGPNGAGKEKIAEIVHANSRRREQPLIKVNAGALPEQLLEAELFGAEAGAFTGATKLRIGRFEAAHGGTLFLDEIGNLPLAGQMKLLRVLQSGEFERVGSSTTRKVDVRVVSATNADLRAAISAGTFREDLFFRLNVIEVRVPPLRERVEDVRPLAEHFLRLHGGDAALAPDAVAALEAHDWPGNVRELENRIQRALLVGRPPLHARDLDLLSAPAQAPRSERSPEADPLSAAERATVEAALTRARGVVSRAAAELGLSRQALYRRMERLGIEIERRTRS
ncbi:MAG: sigma-54-dependent Fis family transcriptional regulator [Myxococcales bacterium]|nr:sigma-54-dependent Fis family transcriptional regulator [Myxococcales bacterium]MCB9578917.1 sigma-54-dependent Fis family transcriptional regulator [Polyangiaceae bacterium]